MHEAAIARRLVGEALERMEGGAGRVTEVEVVLGSSARLSAEAVCEHFQLAARGTRVEGAGVHITWEPGRYWCFDCMFEFSSRARGAATCPRCGGDALTVDRAELAYVRSVGGEAV